MIMVSIDTFVNTKIGWITDAKNGELIPSKLDSCKFSSD